MHSQAEYMDSQGIPAVHRLKIGEEVDAKFLSLLADGEWACPGIQGGVVPDAVGEGGAIGDPEVHIVVASSARVFFFDDRGVLASN